MTREKLLELIAEEKERYGLYSQLCSNYHIKPDPIAEARHSSRIETLETILRLLGK